MIMSSASASTETPNSGKGFEKCNLYELVQYQCEVTSTHIECNPFVRVFLRCPGKPTTEVTPEYDHKGDPVTSVGSSVLPDFGAVGDKKSPPGVVMMENDK
ncbi:hypothetical protein BX666DRAFT_612035 [Dichotomocladium elegans]|nr:hypothetical protein BX666DRAFT_612035 [Dichotomocladium elegans]